MTVLVGARLALGRVDYEVPGCRVLAGCLPLGGGREAGPTAAGQPGLADNADDVLGGGRQGRPQRLVAAAGLVFREQLARPEQVKVGNWRTGEQLSHGDLPRGPRARARRPPGARMRWGAGPAGS